MPYTLSPQELARYGPVNEKAVEQRRGWKVRMASTIEKARKLIAKDDLGALLASGKKMREIRDEKCPDLPLWVVGQLKKEYWPDGFELVEHEYKVLCTRDGGAVTMPERSDKNMLPDTNLKDEVKVTESEPEAKAEPGATGQPGRQVTIRELVAKHDTLQAEIACIERIIKFIKRPSPGVAELLDRHMDSCQQEFAVIEGVMGTTVDVALPDKGDGNEL